MRCRAICSAPRFRRSRSSGCCERRKLCRTASTTDPTMKSDSSVAPSLPGEAAVEVKRNILVVADDPAAARLHAVERKRTEEALRESEERCRRLVEISPDAILVHSEGRFVLVNEAAVKLLGASGPEQLIGKPIVDFVQPKDRSAVQEDVLKPAAPGQSALFVKRKPLQPRRQPGGSAGGAQRHRAQADGGAPEPSRAIRSADPVAQSQPVSRPLERSDGARGLAAIQRHGGLALIESAATAVAAGMPDAAARATVNAAELKLEEIGPHLIELALK